MALATSVHVARLVAERIDVERFARHRSRETLVLAGLAALLPTVFFLSLIVGSTWIPPAHVWAIVRGASGVHDAEAIVVEAIRLPRSLTAILAGASLGVAGLQMQTLFRNPLADPFALGVSAGASLGVAGVEHVERVAGLCLVLKVDVVGVDADQVVDHRPRHLIA